MLTNQDLKRLTELLATKEDLKELATKDDIKELATRSELNGLRSDVQTLERATREGFKKVSEKIESIPTIAHP